MRMFIVSLLLIVLLPVSLFSFEQSHIIVAKDGSGDFSTIQDALNSVPQNNQELVIILIKKGTYNEKLFITKSNIALVGEDRDSTRIVFPQLRSLWKEMNGGSDWGSAVVNIDSAVENITLANITIYNNYGALYGNHDHQFAIYGNGTRIILLNCNVIADGGDTVSLWNRTTGMYYHANCYFEGWVDFVCPRGWCYITDSKFYSHSSTAAIWHDGSNNKKQKFVIRYSYFDGISGFPLGRNHRDGQIYLLDCIFSRNMADIPIYYPPTTTSGPWKWGARHYYYNCQREGGDYDWFNDNLHTAEGSPLPDSVTPSWVFEYQWDPESAIPAVLSFVSMPHPRNGAYLNFKRSVELRWLPSRNASSFIINMAKVPAYSFVREVSFTEQIASIKPKITVPTPDPQTTYYWRVDEICGKDTVYGPVWHFSLRQK